MSYDVFHIAMLGASDINDRTCRNWPILFRNNVQNGKTKRVRVSTFGFEGQGSKLWLTAKYDIRLANVMADVVCMSFFADGNSVGLSTSTAENLANIYAFVDAVRTKRSTIPIYLLKMWRCPAEASTFPNLSNVYGNYTIVQANRSNISIIDCYTAWGDPALHPEEYDAGDQIHPLLSGHQRVTLPVVTAALASLIT